MRRRYSFGICMWEIIMHQVPYGSASNQKIQEAVGVVVVVLVVVVMVVVVAVC